MWSQFCTDHIAEYKSRQQDKADFAAFNRKGDDCEMKGFRIALCFLGIERRGLNFLNEIKKKRELKMLSL